MRRSPNLVFRSVGDDGADDDGENGSNDDNNDNNVNAGNNDDDNNNEDPIDYGHMWIDSEYDVVMLMQNQKRIP